MEILGVAYAFCFPYSLKSSFARFEFPNLTFARIRWCHRIVLDLSLVAFCSNFSLVCLFVLCFLLYILVF